MNTVVYLFQVSACMGIFYLFYYLLLSRYTFFTINRWYLLITLAISFVIPLLTITVQQDTYPQVIQQVVYINKMQVPQQVVITSEAPQQVQINWMALAKLVYTLAVGALAIRLLLMVVKFFARVRNKRRTKIGGIHIVKGDEQIRNGSFFNFIFLNDDELSPEELEQIIAHEMLHVKLYHSVDRILAKVAQVFLWFNPFVYLYARAIEENHEFEVDRAVSNSTDRHKYAELLFHLSVARQGTLYHSFSMVPLKKRITMLFTKPSHKMKKIIYLLVVPVVLISCLAFAKLKNEESVESKKPVVNNSLADSSKVKYRQKIKRTPEQEKKLAEANAKWRVYMQSDEYKTKDLLIRKITSGEISATVEGKLVRATDNTERRGFKLNYNGEMLFLNTSYGQEKQLNDLLKVGDKITVKIFGGSITPGEGIGIMPASVTLNGKKIFQLAEADKIPVYPFLYEANKVRFTDGQISNITKYSNGKWKTAVLERVNGYKFNLSFKPNAPNLNSIKWGDHVTLRFVHEVKTGDKIYNVNDWVAITTNIKDYGIKNPDWFSKFYEVVKADTGKISAINGIESLGAKPLVLIDGKEYDKNILYKISMRGVKGTSMYPPNNGTTKYGDKAKDGAVIIDTRDGEINYLTENEKTNIIKANAAKEKFFSRTRLTKEDGSKYDLATISRKSGTVITADVSTNGRIAFIINNKVYSEKDFKRLFPVDKESYGGGGGVYMGTKELVARGFKLDGYEIVFVFETGAGLKAPNAAERTGAIAPGNNGTNKTVMGKPAVLTGGSGDYRGQQVFGLTIPAYGVKKKSSFFPPYGTYSSSNGIFKSNGSSNKVIEDNKKSGQEATSVGKDTVGGSATVNALKQMMAQFKGIVVRADGTVWANNTPINKLKINGKEYNGAEIKQALNTLPADVIDKSDNNGIEKNDLLNSIPAQKTSYKNQNDSLVAARFGGEIVTVKDILGSKLIIIRNDEYFAAYSNLKNANVTTGQKVKTGQLLGVAAFDKDENKIAVHFEVYRKQTLITNKTEQEVIIRDLSQERLNMRLKLGEVYAFKAQ